ncbi:unnamed protein product [Phyllotreta striolata]|uniref:PWWP domain-containing protein n=1 Tax=Phyllotreta striolata TaxID=444603 RepID=A0A9N9TK60_PHYSR|nr:unnamed protein product [Phyllotreta striolata]
MTEESFTDYKDGDIVWVKLGSRWWPGEVKDLSNLTPDEMAFKKSPLAIVQFFEEDAFEYVRNWSNIYPYSCNRKIEFIKKGMNAFRSNVPNMEKFPKDVTTAEIKIGGNPNILSDPSCSVEKRKSYGESYGSPKRLGKDSTKKQRSSSKMLPKDNTHVTHRRFLGVDDYKAYICIQYPGKDRKPGEDEEVARINAEPEQEYNCNSCSYSTRRLEVMVMHMKSHIQGIYVSSPKRKRSVAPRPKKKEYSKKRHAYSEDSDEDLSPPPKEKKPKVAKSSTKKLILEAEIKPKPKPIPSADIRTDLLAEWEDSDEENGNSTFEEPADISGIAKLDEDNKESEDERNDSVKEPSKIQMDKDTRDAIKSCFDFDEEEDETDLITTPVEQGRKIPRVIPPTEKRKSDVTDDVVEEEEDPNKDPPKQPDELETAFEDLMEATSVPELPEVENSLKPAQNFHVVTTIKFPDKPEESPVKEREKSAPINPKKRFVKSFEHFENQLQQEELRKKEEMENSKKRAEATEQVFQDSKGSCTEQEKSSVNEEDGEHTENSIDLSKLQKNLRWKISNHRYPTRRSTNSAGETETKPKKEKKTVNKPKDNCETKPEEEPSFLSDWNDLIEEDKINETKAKTEKKTKRSKSKPDIESPPVNVSLPVKIDKNLVFEVAKPEEKLPNEEEEPKMIDEEHTKEEEHTKQEEHAKEEEDPALSNNSLKEPEDIAVPKENPSETEDKSSDETLRKEGPAIKSHKRKKGKRRSKFTVKKKRRSSGYKEATETEEEPSKIPSDIDQGKETNPAEEVSDNKEAQIDDIQDDTCTIIEKNVAQNDGNLTSNDEDANVNESMEDVKKDSVDTEDNQLINDVIESEDSLPVGTKENDTVIEDETKDNEEIEATIEESIVSKSSEEQENCDKLDDIEELPINSPIVTEEVIETEENKPETPTIVDDTNNDCSANKEDIDVIEEIDIKSTEIEETANREEAPFVDSNDTSTEPSNDKVTVEDSSLTKEVVSRFISEEQSSVFLQDANALSQSNLASENGESKGEVEEEAGPKEVEVTHDSFKFSIQTNLSNLSRSEEISAIALATLSEAKSDESPAVPPPIGEPTAPERLSDTEMVAIEGNLTVMSEQDLADAQVEITTDPVAASKKPATFSVFSMDFPDDTDRSESNRKPAEFHPPFPDDITDFEECIPSQIVCTKQFNDELKKKDRSSTSMISTTSKLLERLTESKTDKTKPVILSEQIVKPAQTGPKKSNHDAPSTNSNGGSTVEDIEDVEAFVIHKDMKRAEPAEEPKVAPVKSTRKSKTKPAGKAKILQQTIITPAGEILQPTTGSCKKPVASPVSENAPETARPVAGNAAGRDDNIFDIFNMPIVLSDQILTPESIENMPVLLDEPSKPVAVTAKPKPRLQQGEGAASAASAPVQKPGKYIIVSSQGGAGGVVPQRFVQKKAVVKRTALPASSSISAKLGGSQEITGNKIMVVTNQQGQQQRLLLTPAQQKVLGYQPAGSKLTKAALKSSVIRKNVAVTKVEAGPSKTVSFVTQKLTNTVTSTPSKAVKTIVRSAKPAGKTPKTILITNKHGQTIKKIATTEDDLDKQVAEQLEAIKASSGVRFGKTESINSKQIKPTVRKSYSNKKQEQPVTKPVPSSEPPPLIATKKPRQPVIESKKPDEPERPLNQLVIQDAMGNQTTITEGQILAIPSETVDGQPQSYVLVTLDRSGNLTPLNNEALMSLDPNLGLGGDLSNMVLQIDQGNALDRPAPLAQPATVKIGATVEELSAGTSKIDVPLPPAEPPTEPPSCVDQGRQLIVTGDPIATRKFLESLAEGSADLAGIIANADGKSILIEADGQQILIDGGQEHYPNRSGKSTDILAAALADTEVFAAAPKPARSSPDGAASLYPINVGGVSETSLTLGSPIMTPLEVPSTNSKKIPDDEADMLIAVPKNVDLPITITDPNISQTVANQQVATMIANELRTNLDLGLGMAETSIASVSASLASPGYGGYSLPVLDDGDVSHKPFDNSMPLLDDAPSIDKKSDLGGGFLEEEDEAGEGRFTLGGAVCSSLSEPPPEMFEIPYGENDVTLSLRSTPDSKVDEEEVEETDGLGSMRAESSSEGSCEIPVQPRIVAKSADFCGM